MQRMVANSENPCLCFPGLCVGLQWERAARPGQQRQPANTVPNSSFARNPRTAGTCATLHLTASIDSWKCAEACSVFKRDSPLSLCLKCHLSE